MCVTKTRMIKERETVVIAEIAKQAEELEDYIIEKRRYFHKHPELSFKEENTTRYIGQQLVQMGLEPHFFEDYYGVWTQIEGNKKGKTVLLRADIDALPITEATGLEYVSDTPGVMHACGHDSHIAMLLGGLKLLLKHQDEIEGTVKVLFQSAEESCHGAEYYVENGFLDNVDAVYGSHVWGTLDAPYINVQPGVRMASCDNFTITVTGKSAHGSTPHDGIDAILVASEIVIQLQSLVSRRCDPRETLVISIGEIHGGLQSNIIADKVVMKGTVRSHNSEVRNKVEDWIRQLAEGIASANGATAELEYDYYPGVLINDEKLCRIALDAATQLYGLEVNREFDSLMGSEDFAYYLEKVPGVFVFIGSKNDELGIDYPHHNDHFTIDENCLKRGAAMYAAFAINYLMDKE